MAKKTDDARQTATADRGKGRVTAAQVAEYLRQHPEFAFAVVEGGSS